VGSVNDSDGEVDGEGGVGSLACVLDAWFNWNATAVPKFLLSKHTRSYTSSCQLWWLACAGNEDKVVVSSLCNMASTQIKGSYHTAVFIFNAPLLAGGCKIAS